MRPLPVGQQRGNDPISAPIARAIPQEQIMWTSTPLSAQLRKMALAPATAGFRCAVSRRAICKDVARRQIKRRDRPHAIDQLAIDMQFE